MASRLYFNSPFLLSFFLVLKEIHLVSSFRAGKAKTMQRKKKKNTHTRSTVRNGYEVERKTTTTGERGKEDHQHHHRKKKRQK
jgi:hypothetical protein